MENEDNLSRQQKAVVKMLDIACDNLGRYTPKAINAADRAQELASKSGFDISDVVRDIRDEALDYYIKKDLREESFSSYLCKIFARRDGNPGVYEVCPGFSADTREAEPSKDRGIIALCKRVFSQKSGEKPKTEQ